MLYFSNFTSLKIFQHSFHNIIKRVSTKICYARVKIFQKHKYVYPVGKFLSQTSQPTSGRIFFEYLLLNECKRKRLAPFNRATRYFNQRVMQLYGGREDVRTIDNRWCVPISKSGIRECQRVKEFVGGLSASRKLVKSTFRVNDPDNQLANSFPRELYTACCMRNRRSTLLDNIRGIQFDLIQV